MSLRERFNVSAVTRWPTREACVQAWNALGVGFGLDEYVMLKMELGDSMLATEDDNTRFWINRPGKAKDFYSLQWQFDCYRFRTQDARKSGRGTFELYGKEHLLAKLIGIDVVDGFIPLFCNSEYDNWLGWIETQGGWKLLELDLGMQSVHAVWDGVEDMLQGVSEFRFGEGLTYDQDGRIVMVDLPPERH